MIMELFIQHLTDFPLTHPQQTPSVNSELSQGMKPGNQPGKRKASPRNQGQLMAHLPHPG